MAKKTRKMIDGRYYFGGYSYDKGSLLYILDQFWPEAPDALTKNKEYTIGNFLANRNLFPIRVEKKCGIPKAEW